MEFQKMNNTNNITKPEFIRHKYELTHQTKSYNVYAQTNEKFIKSALTDLCRIEEFRGLSNGKGFDKYLRLRTSTSWNNSEKVSGLKYTTKANVFYGDRRINGKQNLIVFVFNNDLTQLIIDYYRGYYPHNQTILKKILQDY